LLAVMGFAWPDATFNFNRFDAVLLEAFGDVDVDAAEPFDVAAGVDAFKAFDVAAGLAALEAFGVLFLLLVSKLLLLNGGVMR
jgi:hypothetical protein